MSSCDVRTDGSFQSFSFGAKRGFGSNPPGLDSSGLDVKAATQAPKLERSEVDRYTNMAYIFNVF